VARILLVDDHEAIRRGIRGMLGEHLGGRPDEHRIDEASNGEEAMKKIVDTQYDLVILDISLPDLDGIEVLKGIRFYKADLPVLVFTIYPAQTVGLKAMAAGASGYLSKCASTEELNEAVKQILRGEKYISPGIVEKMASTICGDLTQDFPHEKLTSREYQVFLGIASGKHLNEIAKEMSVRPQTVSTNRARILKKMDMKTNIELFHYAVENHLIDARFL
jgi:two-component system, NarL family, invasion response regulator UvrY